jgi:hypothetical protein
VHKAADQPYILGDSCRHLLWDDTCITLLWDDSCRHYSETTLADTTLRRFLQILALRWHLHHTTLRRLLQTLLWDDSCRHYSEATLASHYSETTLADTTLRRLVQTLLWSDSCITLLWDYSCRHYSKMNICTRLFLYKTAKADQPYIPVYSKHSSCDER